MKNKKIKIISMAILLLTTSTDANALLKSVVGGAVGGAVAGAIMKGSSTKNNTTIVNNSNIVLKCYCPKDYKLRIHDDGRIDCFKYGKETVTIGQHTGTVIFETGDEAKCEVYNK